MGAVMIRSVHNLRCDLRSNPEPASEPMGRYPRRSSFKVVGTGLKEFAPFQLDMVNQCMWRVDGHDSPERIPLKPKPFDILHYLAAHAGRLVTQEELLQAVWPGVYVQQEVLKRHIFEIRGVLGDDPKNPVFIETMPRRGYRFIAPVRDLASPEPSIHGNPADSRLVGRDSALDALRQCLARAAEGHRQLVFVTGEPGIGKTSLVDEFRKLEGSPVRVARGQCVEGYGGTEAYYPILEAIGNLGRGPDGEAVVDILAAQAPTWLVQFPALLSRHDHETLQREIAGATRMRMLREIGEALETITAEIPLILIVEDLHWADHSTVDLISALARGRGPARLLVIGTYRPVDVTVSDHPLKVVKQDLAVHQLCREIALQPLAEDEIEAWLAGEPPDPSVPKDLAALLHRHSEGNPLYMVAALEHMTERGLVSREHGRWQTRIPVDEIDLEVPESLRQMIEAQVDRLSPEQQRVLEAASIESVGRSRFVVAARAGCLDMDPCIFEEICETLARRHCIVRPAAALTLSDGRETACYEFVHTLYREVCYLRMTPRRRALLHRRIGQWLEVHFKPLSEAATWLAAHFEQGADWPRAVGYLQLAADSATRRLEHREAVAILRQALELAGSLAEQERIPLEIEILERLAVGCVALAETGAAIETYERLSELAAGHGLIELQARALTDMALPAASVSARSYSDTVERALRLADGIEDPLSRVRTQARCYALKAVAGQWRSAEAERCQQAMEEIDLAGDRLAIAEHRLQFTYMQSFSSQYGEAHRNGRESLEILLAEDGLNHYPRTLCRIHRYHLAPRNLLFWGKWGQALEQTQAMKDLLEKNGDFAKAQEVLIHKARVHFAAMDFAGVVEICESVAPFVRTPSNVRKMRTLMGWAQAAMGNHERALEQLLLVRDQMDEWPMMDDWYTRMPLQAAFTELWLARGDVRQARMEAEKFLDVAMVTAERTYQGLAWEANARVAIDSQKWERAEECIANALSVIRDCEVPLAAWRVHGTAARLLDRACEEGLAENHREMSRSTIIKLANSLHADDTLRETFLLAPAVRGVLDRTMRAGG